jgi:hypothetical protein
MDPRAKGDEHDPDEPNDDRHTDDGKRAGDTASDDPTLSLCRVAQSTSGTMGRMAERDQSDT